MPEFNCNVISIIFVIIIFGVLIYMLCTCKSKKNVDHMEQLDDAPLPTRPLLSQNDTPVKSIEDIIDNIRSASSCVAENIFSDDQDEIGLGRSDSLSENNVMLSEMGRGQNNRSRRTPEDLEDIFDIDQMLPGEIRKDWFDVAPLQNTKNINSESLITPQYLFGLDTSGSSKRLATHDPRGNLPIKKASVGPWMNSSIDTDYSRGYCN